MVDSIPKPWISTGNHQCCSRDEDYYSRPVYCLQYSHKQFALTFNLNTLVIGKNFLFVHRILGIPWVLTGTTTCVIHVHFDASFPLKSHGQQFIRLWRYSNLKLIWKYIKNKLGLYWAKLSSSWDWTLLKLISIKWTRHYCLDWLYSNISNPSSTATKVAK